ncbi:hypothetical protein PsAD5_02419 [Pseudovibrio sp. Ad5]|uniref:hypothetical protein n=1 Tax=Pseudovibrio sp. Ad5 TaxID=989436 RepID=UPI0007AE5637|nr:hypothetical protein [Pseudovibrio sp. Ad5]KZK96824.1 hypothetical protein PsAD5_02419 [Pseudovibrio sp. Ad5]
MPLPENFVEAVYVDPGLERYRDNPLIEALPPIMDLSTLCPSSKIVGQNWLSISGVSGPIAC